MTADSITQEEPTDTLAKNHRAFRYQYGRLNAREQKTEQKNFCERYMITPVSFRARLGGTCRVSDTELAYLKSRVDTYFPAIGLATLTTH